MINKTIRAFIIGIVTVFSSTVYAQKNIETQHLLWMRCNIKLKLNDNYQLGLEMEERAYWFPWRQHQMMSRTQLERKLGNGWSTGVGFASFIQSLPQDPNIKNYSNQVELRPQFELAYKQSISEKLILQHRYLSEFRFFQQPNGPFSFSNTRLRYKLELRYSPIEQISFKVFEEIHLNVGKKIIQNVFDQNRYGTSILYQPTKKLGLELGYINWFQQRKSGVDFYNRQIFRATIHISLNLKKHSS